MTSDRETNPARRTPSTTVAGRPRPTIHDVAALANVSKSLVSLAMQGSPKVAPASRAAIMAAAETLGYRPNAAARGLAVRRSRTVGVLVVDLHNPIFAELLDGVQEQLRDLGYATMLVSGGPDAGESPGLEKLLEFQVEGLILISHSLPGLTIRRLAAEVPTVVVTRRDVRGPRLDSVANDDVAGARLAVEHLLSLNHRRITHLDGGDNPVSAERCRGYREAMAAAGLESRVVPGGLTDAAGYTAALDALDARDGTPAPTALFVANDLAALGAIAAAQGRGLDVPGDLSVIGYDGMALGALRALSLTTIAQPLTEIGTLAAQQLVRRIENPHLRARHSRLGSSLVVRGSTGPAPS